MDCLFCKILKKEIPSDCVYEDDNVYAFKDINPQAPIHIIVIPKKHIESINEFNQDNISIATNIMQAIPKVAEKIGIKYTGYRVITNCGEDGCQSVKHLHFHLLGGKKLSETLA